MSATGSRSEPPCARTAGGTPATGPGRRPVQFGIACFVVSMMIYTLLDAVAKGLLEHRHLVQLVWFRFVFHALTLLLVMPRKAHHLRMLPPPRLALHGARAACLLGVSFTFYAGLLFIPLAEATILVQTAPFLVALLAMVFLKEQLDRWRWGAIVVGFAGAFLVIRPGFGVLHWGAIFPLLTAAIFSVLQIVTRRLAGQAAWTTLFTTAVIGACVLTPIVPFYWTAPAAGEVVRMVLIGVCAAVADALTLRAFVHAPASTIAPFGYIQIVWAVLLGYLFFGDLPDTLTIAGTGVIVASGLFLLRRVR